MISPLTVEELELAVKSGRMVNFHPDYSSKTGKTPCIIKEVCKTGNDIWDVFIDGHVARCINKAGFGFFSNKPMFIWAEKVENVSVPQDGKCHCSTPKPVLLLFNYVCDGCGGKL